MELMELMDNLKLALLHKDTQGGSLIKLIEYTKKEAEQSVPKQAETKKASKK